VWVCYIALLAREDEKYKMKKINEQLTNERLHLEHKSSQLADLIAVIIASVY